jgi:HTH-type transcriptional regulator/antitoxin HigA
MDVRPINTETDYDWALKEIEQYFDHEPPLGTPEAARFDVLSTLIEAYEDEHWRIEAPDPVAAIQETMERLSLTQSDLGQLFGSRSRASEILHRKRPLTMRQAWLLHREWKIPAETLLRPMDGSARTS